MDPYTLSAILTLQTLSSCAISAFGQYVYAYYTDSYPGNGTANYSTISTISSLKFLKKFNDDNKQCSPDAESPDDDALAYAQERSADLFFWMTLYNSFPVIMMTYILGLYVLKLGIRFVLLLPLFGSVVEGGIWLLVIYFHLPEYWWYIGTTLNGFTGADGVLGFVLTLIITDSTSEDDLSARLVRIGAVQTVISAVATFGVGNYIQWRGFTDLFWYGFALNLLTMLVVIIFYKPETSNSPEVNERTPLLTSTNEVEVREPSNSICGNFFEVCTVFLPNRRSKKKTASIFLTLFAVIFFSFASQSFAPILWYMLDVPFCWTSTEIGNYSALSALSSALLSVLGLKALTAAGAGDPIICMISHLFFCASSVWIAFARRSWELYASLFLSAFAGYQSTLTVVMMTKWLEPNERPNAFAFLTIMGTIISSFGSALFNYIYARTVVNYRNLTILIGAGICIIPFILNL
jgi:MFS family permease